MRKVSVIIFILLAVCFGLACKLSAQVSVKDHLITATVQKDTYIYSEPIEVTIKYKNSGTTDWRLRKPDNALSVEVHYGHVGDAENAFRYTMGKTESHPGPEGSDIMAFTMPEPEYIVIRPGKEYTLISRIPWPGMIFPGKWILWVEDIIEKLRTETLGFQIIFTKESPDALLTSAKNPENNPYARSSHAKYLRELRTDMPKFKWPDWRDSPAEKNRKEEMIQKNLRKFEDFWNKEKNSPDTEKAIERINRVCREITESYSPFKLSCPDILEFRR